MFSIGQREAVRSAFRLAGYDGALQTWPVNGAGELVFVVDTADWRRLTHRRDLELVLHQLLGREAWIVEMRQGHTTVPFA